jgi:tetratricopeptide (TPR) repeat protein
MREPLRRGLEKWRRWSQRITDKGRRTPRPWRQERRAATPSIANLLHAFQDSKILHAGDVRYPMLAFLLAIPLAGSETLDRARQLYQEKNYSAAVELLEPVARIDGPDAPEASRWIGKIARKQRKALEAVRWHEKAVGLKPADATFWLELGDAYGLMAMQVSIFEKLEWARKCERALSRAVELAPGSFQARAALLDFCLEAPELAGGGKRRAHDEVEKFKAVDLAGGTRLQVVVLEKERRFDEALQACRGALQLHPNDYALLYTLGRTAALSGTYQDDAYEALRRCLDLTAPEDFPGHAGVWFRLGDLEKLGGRPDLARAAYARALELDPSLSQAKEALDALNVR